MSEPLVEGSGETGDGEAGTGVPMRGAAVLDVPGGTDRPVHPDPADPARLEDVPAVRPMRPSRRDSLRRRLFALADMGSLSAAYGVVWLVAPPHSSLTAHLWLIGALPLWVVLNKLLGLYDRDANVIHKSTLDELGQIGQSVVVGSALLFLCAPIIPSFEVQREQTVVFMLAALVLMPATRTATRAAFSRRAVPERCLIVGSGRVAQSLRQKLAAHPEYRAECVGFIDEPGPGPETPEHDDVHLIRELSDFERACARLDVERVIVAFGSMSHERLLGVIRSAKDLNLKVTVVPRLFEGIGDAVEIEQVEGMTLFGLRGLARTRSSLRLKRSFDILVATIGLLTIAPLLAVIAIAIKLDSPGPIIFRQRRVGRDQRPFHILKFRTMQSDADEMKESLEHLNEAAAPMFKITADPRITRVGRLLRRYSLDELPQLWNVVRGEMSLVGPRPLVPSENDHVTGRHRTRLDLTPGVTGPWQVMGRTNIPFSDMIRLDYLYVAEWSLWNDVKLLLRTAPVVFTGRGH